MLIDRESIICDLNATNITVFVFEEVASVLEGVEVSKSEVWGGHMTPETVEISLPNEDEFWYAERGGTASKCSHVVPLCYVVHHHEALPPHYFLSFKRRCSCPGFETAQTKLKLLDGPNCPASPQAQLYCTQPNPVQKYSRVSFFSTFNRIQAHTYVLN